MGKRLMVESGKQRFEQGLEAVNAGDLEQGIHCFRQAVQMQPADAEVVACLGQTLYWAGWRKEGVDYLCRAGQLLIKAAKKSRKIEDVLALSEQLQGCNDFKGALSLLQQAVKIDNRDARLFQLQAQALLRLNRVEQALTAVRLGLARSPDNSALALLRAEALLRTGDLAGAHKRLHELLQQPNRLSPDLQMRAHRALAVVLDKCGEYREVFSHLHEAARIGGKLPDMHNLDKQLLPALLKQNRDGYRDELLRSTADIAGSGQRAPVFVVGMLRSGTTLVQEVLSAHSAVFVADEADLMTRLRAEIERMRPGDTSFPEKLRTLNKDDVMHLRNCYWQDVEAYYGGPVLQTLLVDKTSLNLLDTGLMNFVFPDAKIIVVQRDPRDICLSCFMQTFQPSLFSTHLSSWNETLGLTVMVMNQWLEIKPRLTVPCLEISYEEAVTAFEPVFRRVFDFLELPWESSVLRFHRKAADKFVASPSYHQVAQPLYQSSIGRWQHYREEFSQAGDAFSELIQKLGYEE